MQDWNVVVTIHEGHFHQAVQFLERFGSISRTNYFNVLVMKVPDIGLLLQGVAQAIEASPILERVISRLMPASMTFNYQAPAEFESKATQAVEPWVPQLAGSRFHVRMHRRGFKERLSSQNEERFLDHFLMAKLDEQGVPGSIDFEDPDFIIDIETVDQRAGVSLWTREQRLHFPFLKLD
jgi:tRNA(Ser,Leu) C12 N-acetylase TAN1